MKKRLALLLGFILALVSLFVFAGDISIPIPDHKGKIHVIIDVRSEGGTPLPGVTVDLFGTAYYTGNPSSQYRKTDMYEVQTDQNGSIDMLIASWDSPGKIIINDQSQDARGSYLTVRAYAPDYRQLTQGDTFFAADNSAPLNYVNQITIKMKSYPAGTKNTLYGVGLRESLYGLTRPYGDMAFYFNKPPLNQRPDKYMHYPTPDQTNNFVQHLSQRVAVNGLQPQKNMHVVIVTQTDPGTFIEGRRGGGWGPTYLLWNETDPNSGSDTKPENVKFLDDVHDLYGRYFDGSDQNLLNWYNVDQILSKYDQDLDAEVYIQIESGNVNIYWILEAVYNRFCNPALGQNHPCVKGFGIDTEWYNNVDPFDAKESDIISKSLGNHI